MDFKKKWEALEKRVADLEGRVQGQQEAFNFFLDSEKQSQVELKEILKNLKISMGLIDGIDTSMMQ